VFSFSWLIPWKAVSRFGSRPVSSTPMPITRHRTTLHAATPRSWVLCVDPESLVLSVPFLKGSAAAVHALCLFFSCRDEPGCISFSSLELDSLHFCISSWVPSRGLPRVFNYFHSDCFKSPLPLGGLTRFPAGIKRLALLFYRREDS